MKEGTKMIYDAMDALQKPVSNGWTEKLERLEKENKRLRHENRKISTLEEALKKACAVIHEEADSNSYMGCTLAAITEGRSPECDYDCDKCLPAYFIELVEQEKRKVVCDEIEGRKRMDEQDTKKAAKDNINLQSLDDIVRRAEGLGRELEEKMRR